MTSQRKKQLLIIFKLAIAIAIFAWLLTGPMNLRQLANVPFSFRLVVLGAVVLVSMLLPAVRWWWLLRIQRIDATLWRATSLTWVGYLTSLVLPGAASGDVAKSCLVLRDQPERRLSSFSTVLVDRVVGLYSLILLSCLSSAWCLLTQSPAPPLRLLCFGTLAVGTGTSFAPAIIYYGPVRHWLALYARPSWIEAWTESGRFYAQSKVALAGCLLVSLASSALTSLSLTAADRVLGGNVSWSTSLLVGPLVVLSNCVPVTPGGVGVAEATSSALFGETGSANGAEMMLMIRLTMAFLSLPALLILFTSKQKPISSSPEIVPVAPVSTAGTVPERRESRAA